MGLRNKKDGIPDLEERLEAKVFLEAQCLFGEEFHQPDESGDLDADSGEASDVVDIGEVTGSTDVDQKGSC